MYLRTYTCDNTHTHALSTTDFDLDLSWTVRIMDVIPQKKIKVLVSYIIKTETVHVSEYTNTHTHIHTHVHPGVFGLDRGRSCGNDALD